MKYTTEIQIDLPRDEVIRKLDNPENMKHWLRGLADYEMISGTPGYEGAKMKMEFQQGKRKTTIVETITKREMPTAFHAVYDTKGVHNIQQNFFHDIDGKSTKWVSESEFQFAGFGLKLMGWLMPGAFKKQSLKHLQDFKDFAEKGISVTGEVIADEEE